MFFFLHILVFSNFPEVNIYYFYSEGKGVSILKGKKERQKVRVELSVR